MKIQRGRDGELVGSGEPLFMLNGGADVIDERKLGKATRRSNRGEDTKRNLKHAKPLAWSVCIRQNSL